MRAKTITSLFAGLAVAHPRLQVLSSTTADSTSDGPPVSGEPQAVLPYRSLGPCFSQSRKGGLRGIDIRLIPHRGDDMRRRTLAALATLVTVVGGTTLAAATPAAAATSATTYCQFPLTASNGDTSAGDIKVTLAWHTSASGGTIYADSITIFNDTGRSITLTKDRWQSSAGVDRGPGGQVQYSYGFYWSPPDGWPNHSGAAVSIAAYATTRPGLGMDRAFSPGQSDRYCTTF